MKKYIDCDKLVKVLKDCVSPNVMAFLQEQVIDFLPAEDVAPVVHGTWRVLATENHTDAVCSICKKSFYYYNKGQYHIDHSNYCPNCGAKMDGGQG